MHLLVTRPEADAAELKARLEAMGHRVSLAPLLEVDFSAPDPIDLAGVQALIATSRNGVRALRESPACASALALPLFAVGSATAEAARQAGFTRVIEGPGRAADLVPLIAERVRRDAGPLLHLAGDHLAFDLKLALEQQGFEVREATLYRTRAAEALPPAVADAIRAGTLDAVLLMSPRTAETFSRLVRGAGLAAAAQRLGYFCMSKAVAQGLAGLEPVRVNVAVQPSFEEMLALVTGLTPESS